MTLKPFHLRPSIFGSFK